MSFSIKIPVVHGLGRDPENEQFIWLSLDRSPTDDELRNIHDILTGRATGFAVEVTSSPIFSMSINLLNQVKSWVDDESRPAMPQDLQDHINAVLMAYEQQYGPLRLGN